MKTKVLAQLLRTSETLAFAANGEPGTGAIAPVLAMAKTETALCVWPAARRNLSFAVTHNPDILSPAGNGEPATSLSEPFSDATAST